MNVTELEKSFAEKIGVKHCIAVNSGTSARHACLHAMGVGPGDEVISPAMTVVMNTFATLYLGATPVYADIDPHTFLIDAESIERKITKRTKAIQIVSLYGLPCDIDDIMRLSFKHKSPILEDNAQCLLGRYSNGMVAGSIPHMSIFSTESSKHISSGEGGFICTNDSDMALRARKFSGLGYRTLSVDEGRPKLNKEMFHMPEFKRHDYVGFNYRMPQPCVDLLGPQVKDMESIVNMRITCGKAYDSVLSKYDFFSAQDSNGGINSYWSYATSYSGPVTWKEFYNRFRENGGEGFHGSLSLPYQEPFSSAVVKDCPMAEKLQPTIMQFHTNYKTVDHLDREINCLKKTLRSI